MTRGRCADTYPRRIRADERTLKLLLAYARDFTRPRGYRLEDLAKASGYSVSGTRTAYSAGDIAEVMRRTGRQPRARQREHEAEARVSSASDGSV